MATEIFELTLRLQWGTDSCLDIEVPVRYGRSKTADGRYNVFIDGVPVGWVSKRSKVQDHAGTWAAWIAHDQQGPYPRGHAGQGFQVAAQCRTRREAVQELMWELAQHASLNALADRADEARTLDKPAWPVF